MAATEASTDLGRMDRITSVVLGLLFDLSQQAARFGSGTNPWGQLAVYDVDDFALFTREGRHDPPSEPLRRRRNGHLNPLSRQDHQ
ncbi:hypothetical protein ACKI1Q_08625 [Streptomyces galilaeus]|uniref:hypothetical protein n=1 Tax=Streptomyces galilaeus TaxID=33899 RepID=UPI0038F7A3ED